MNHVPRAERQTHHNSDSCVAHEYPQPTTELDAAVIELSGRYPTEGWALNLRVTSLVHVISGKGTAQFEDRLVELDEDDQLLIAAGEKYVLSGTMKLLFAAAPKWTSDQAQNPLS